ncbi:hypothetical protein FB567DRAFT_531482 [Paraphoma chrysanthemicola]|uniref:YggU-like protein n=1 Tax=Paraphoma chrysanthemicola TaxID=798071 RepID=A0A8K0QZQ3_9PLEO|nr:hypothetical protein FB567DRAFT_531482 [Paraphoma chrysanthemicola]
MTVLRPKNALPSVGAAVRWFAGSGKGDQNAVRLLCHVKPGVSATREGVSAITDEYVEVCVASQARDGEANKAVVKVIAEAVKLPKSNVQIVKGLQSRQKVVNIEIATDASPKEKVEWVWKALTSSLRN